MKVFIKISTIHEGLVHKVVESEESYWCDICKNKMFKVPHVIKDEVKCYCPTCDENYIAQLTLYSKE